MRVFYKFSNTFVSFLLAFVFQTFSDNVLFAVAGKIKFNLQKMSVNFSQHRPRCLKCDLHKVLGTQTQRCWLYQRFLRSNKAFLKWCMEKIRWRSGGENEAQASWSFPPRPIFVIPESSRYVKRENGSSNYQRTQWDRFLHAGWHFDLRGNNESNQKLPLGSQPICDMFTLGFEDLHVSVWLFVHSQPPSLSLS